MPHTNATKKPKLRREAEALRIDALSISQAKALGKLAGLMKEAMDTSVGGNQRRGSRLAFVSGAKGTGKSSLIYTLKPVILDDCPQSDRRRKDEGNADEGEQIIKDAIVGHVRESFEGKRKAVRWLQPLTLDPLPPGANLLGAVLSRIEDAIGAVERDNKSSRGALDPHGSLDRARNMLHSLKSDAIKALEGNLQLHASRLDPNNYAIAASAAEATKINLKERLDSVLDNILAGGGDDPTNAARQEGIFAMFIDDLDLRPSKAIEALKLAHLLSSRRLFYIFVGSLPDLDHVLFLNVQGEFKELLGQDNRAVELDKIEANANEIASSLLRKLIPSGQQIFVEDMTVAEALEYDTNAAIGDKTSEKLKPLIEAMPPMVNDMASNPNITEEDLPGHLREFHWNYGIARSEPFKPKGLFRLADLLTMEACHSTGQGDEPLYDGAAILESTPRHVGDAFHLLAEIKLPEKVQSYLAATDRPHIAPKSKEFDYRKNLARWMRTMFKGHVDEDGLLTVPVQDVLKECVEAHDIWELTPPDGMRVRAVVGDTLDVTPFEWRNSVGMAPIDLKITIARVLRHNLEIPKKKAEDNATNPGHAIMGKRTRPAFKLMHDFFKFSGIGVVTRTIETVDELAAVTKWDLGFGREMSIHWAIKSWATFWHRDVFRDLWNDVFQQTRSAFRQRSRIAETDYVPFLILGWMAATFQTADAHPSDKGLARYTSIDSEGCGGEGKSKYAGVSILNALVSDGGAWRIDQYGMITVKVEICRVIDELFDALVSRIMSGQLDEHSRALQDRIVEVILLCMPEAGPLTFMMEFDDKNRTSAFGRDKYMPREVQRSYLSVLEHVSTKMFDLYHDNIIKADDAGVLRADEKKDVVATEKVSNNLFHDIMRDVRRRRIDNIGINIGTPLGFGMLTFTASIMSGKYTGDMGGVFECLRENFKKDVEWGMQPAVEAIFRECRPSPRHLEKAFHYAFGGDDSNPFGGKVRKDEWRYVVGILDGSIKREADAKAKAKEEKQKAPTTHPGDAEQ